MQIVALGFFGVIFLGGVILWLPICNQKPIEFIDALFTICDVGLRDRTCYCNSCGTVHIVRAGCGDDPLSRSEVWE